MMKLYNTQRAPSARRARILLSEKSVSNENIQVELSQKENMGNAYLQINPRGTVPSLVTEEGEILCENVGIASYIEEQFFDPLLLGCTPIERALIGISNHAQIPALIERGRRRTAAFFEALNDNLEGREFVASEGFSFADITCAITFDFAG